MPRILFVGRDPTLTELNEKLLRRNGFDAQSTVGIQNTVNFLKEQNVDLIIADLELNVFKSIQLCQTLKKKKPKIRLLMITGFEDDEIPILNAGADDWIKKPYHMGVLYARVNALLRQ